MVSQDISFATFSKSSVYGLLTRACAKDAVCRRLSPPTLGVVAKATMSARVPIRLRHAPLWSGLDLERLRSLIAFLTPQSLNFFHLQTWTPGTHVYDSRQPPTTSPKGFSCRRPRANHRRAQCQVITISKNYATLSISELKKLT